jgi:hypothetical protein
MTNAPQTQPAPVEVAWYRGSQRVILMQFPVQFSWEDFRLAKARADALMDDAAQPCALVLCFPQTVPALKDLLSHARLLLSSRHPRSRHFLVVSQNEYVQSLGRVLNAITPAEDGLVEVAASLTEADARLLAAGYLEPAQLVD